MLRSPFDERLIDYSKPTLLNYKTENIFAAKTGSDKSNSYAIGFNPLYTIGVWSGTDDNQLFTKSHISKKVFQSVANSLEFDSLWYNPPSYILKKKINPITVKEIKNGSEYWFFKDY
jgi:membrane peptidoglycan carboxypeptidase